MSCPLDDAQVESRRIGHLDKEDPMSRQLRDAGRVVLERERMEAVKHEAECRMRGVARPFPVVF